MSAEKAPRCAHDKKDKWQSHTPVDSFKRIMGLAEYMRTYLQKDIFSVSVFVVMSWKNSTTLVKRLCVLG